MEQKKIDSKKLERKWTDRWKKENSFDADAKPGTKKFFVTFPYPYVNGLLHIGHFYTLMRVEAFARYKRLQGFNVLFPQGWHCTGSPIETAAQRIKEGEKKQIQIMKDMGFSAAEIKKFEEPVYWTKVFPKKAKEDYMRMGLSVDFRRSFITTELNPYYDKFIRWQFNKLLEGKYIGKGKHPVVWCPKEEKPVGDHARSKGEGETPQEFTLLKFKSDGEFLVAATLRPETVFGQTNLWVGPDTEYVKAEVSKGDEAPEVWILSEAATEKLKEQEWDVAIIGKVKGQELLGRKAVAPMIDKAVPILPSAFCDPDKGTGIVTSVPSDAPDDWMGLHDLQEDKAQCEKYGLKHADVLKIKPVAIIDADDLGDMAAVKVCEDMKIKTQHEREKLDEAKKLVYKKGFYGGVMNKNCGKYAGLKVEEAKGQIKDVLIAKGQAALFYELTGAVVCRCLTTCVVKVVKDQWFLKYGDKKWKQKVLKSLKGLTLYPEKSRQQFENTINWLNDWACTREVGLGTRLPWDEDWIIESLSDSTLYMAYYTIAHLLEKLDKEQVDDALFDYVFLGKGSKPKVENIDLMQQEFNYWYPVDFRNSGKDLIQNHLSFYLFNHTAIFPQEKWPRGIGVNGWVTVDGQKMSKSLGNMIPLREMAEKFGVDVSRATILLGGEGLDDPNWDSGLAVSLQAKLQRVYDLIAEQYDPKATKGKLNKLDSWLVSRTNEIIRDATDAMEATLFRTAQQLIFFDFQQTIRWYLKRAKENPNKGLLKDVLEQFVVLLSPFMSVLAEELWEQMGKNGLVLQASWPAVNNKVIDKKLGFAEVMLEQIMTDIQQVMKLAKIDAPKEIQLFVASPWKYSLFSIVKELYEHTKNPKDVMKELMADPKLKKHGKTIATTLPRLLKSGKLPAVVTSQAFEMAVIKEALDFFEKEYVCKVTLTKEDDAKEKKSAQALPGKPAIMLA